MPTHEEWKTLQGRLARREPDAAETLYLYVKGLCARHARRGNRDDLVQELMQCVVRQLLHESRIHQLVLIQDLRAFLSAMVNNLARRFARDEGRQLSLEAVGADNTLPAAAAAPEAPVLRDDLKGRVRACLDALPQADREVLTLRWGDELNSRAIARVLTSRHGSSVSRDAVDARLRRALTRLRRLLVRWQIFPPRR